MEVPPKWQVVLTANPDGGDYSVTPMDDAMLTRMMHITMEFDVKAWSRWAEAFGIDPRGINFVLTYPEAISGKRTTPRTLVQFFESIRHIEDLKEELDLVTLLANSALDKSTAQAFISYINNLLNELIAPQEILDATTFKKEVADPLQEICVKDGTIRADILGTLCTRVVNHVTINKVKLSAKQNQNLIDFLKLEFIPNDLRLMTLGEITHQKNSSLKNILSDPELGQLVLNRM